MVLQRFFVCVCGRVARAVADRLRAASPASTDDLTVEPRGELDRRRRTRSRGSFGALTLILQQVKRQVQKNIQECDSRVHSPSGAKSSLVPLSKTRGSVFCVVILVARRRRDLRGLVSGVDVCVCVLQRRRRAFLDSFPTHPSNIFESVRVARGGRSPSGTQSKVCDFTGWIYSPMSHQIGKEKPSRESSCVPRGESAASPASGLASYRLPKPTPARPKSWERSVVARRADGERRLLRVRRRGALHACGVARA